MLARRRGGLVAVTTGLALVVVAAVWSGFVAGQPDAASLVATQKPHAPPPVRYLNAPRPDPAVEALPSANSPMRATTATSVALTFDDGPSPQWTPKLLAMLSRYHVTATFCLIGMNVAAHPDLVRLIVAAGHTLCNHSWSHDESLGRLGASAIRADMARTNAAIRAAAPDAGIPYYRQPGGFWTPAIVDTARGLGMQPLSWDIDPRDWALPPTPTIARAVTAGCRAGNIILLHDGGGDRSRTFAALQAVLPSLTRRYRLTALPDAGVP